MKKEKKEKEKILEPNRLTPEQIKTNIHCIDFAETYQLLFGSRERSYSFKYELLSRLFQIHQDDFPKTLVLGKPITSRALTEAFVQGSDLIVNREIDKETGKTKDSYATTYFHDKERFFSIDLFDKFVKDVYEERWIENELIYHKRGSLDEVNQPGQCDREFRNAWKIIGEKNQTEFFFEMGRLAVQAYYLSKPGLSPGAPNQAWMDIFGMNEGVCSMLRKWFWVNVLCLAKDKFGERSSSSIKIRSQWYEKPISALVV